MSRMTMAKRNRMWHRAILALMNCPTIASAAQQVGVNIQTLESWMKDEDFAAQLRQAQADALGHGVIMITLRIGETIQRLHEIVMDREVNPGIAAGACYKEIELATKILSSSAAAETVKRLTDELEELRREKAASAKVYEVASGEGDGKGPGRGNLGTEEASRAKRAKSSRQPPPLLASFGKEADEGGDQAD